MKKLKFVMIILFATLTVTGFSECGSGNNPPPEPKPTDDIVFYQRDNGTVDLDWMVWGLSNKAYGDISFEDIQAGVMDGVTMYLHTKTLNNNKGVCDDVIAEGYIDRDGWLIFNFEDLWTWDGFLERFWASDADQCGPKDPKVSWAYVPKERNTFKRDDCNGKPGIEAIFWEYQITPVPPDTPCDEVGPGCT